MRPGSSASSDHEIILVVNDHAADVEPATVGAVAGVLGALGEVRLFASEPHSFDRDLLREATAADLVVVAGGDGSFNWTINALRDRLADVNLALIPMGTGNDLARTLRLPLEPVAAAHAIVNGSIRKIDYGVARGAGVERLFANACVGGFPVAVDEAVNARLKSLFGPFAFWLAGTKALPHLERARVTINGRVIDDCVVIGVGNGRTVGGGIPLFRNAVADDGCLDSCGLAVDDLASAVRVLQHVVAGTQNGLDEIVEFRSTRVTIEAERAVELNVDGDLVGLTTPAVFDVAGALSMRLPDGDNER